MKKCILCGESLYQNMTFSLLFKNNHHIHETCLLKRNIKDITTFPFQNILIEVHVLFPSKKFPYSKEDIFLYYGCDFFLEIDQSKIYILIDDIINDQIFILLAKLTSKAVRYLCYTTDYIFG
jgi:hypothetical protein